MSTTTQTSLNDCGGCQGIGVPTPVRIDNRPGLSAITYRAGAHNSFKASMLARISTLPALRALTTRADDDFSVALMDSWAAVLDVLTFYQERLANEHYLRTARERLSLLELGRLIGYELRPGVAARVALAFTVDQTPGAPPTATIDRGAKVQSVPGQDEQAQTFETVEAIQARAAWNAMAVRQTKPQLLGFGATYAFLKGTATNLRKGDVLLLVGSERVSNPGSERWDVRRVVAVAPDFVADRTLVTWDRGLGSFDPPSGPAAAPEIYALRLRAGLFGYNAVDPRTLHADVVTKLAGSMTADKTEWAFHITGNTLHLDNVYPAVQPEGWLVLSRPEYQELYRVEKAAPSSQTNYAMSTKTTKVVLDTTENLSTFAGGAYRGTVAFTQSEWLPTVDQPDTSDVAGDIIDLAGAFADLPVGRTIILTGHGVDASGQVSDQLTSEVAVIDTVTVLGDGATRLTLNSALIGRYQRSSVTVNANVANATHGETVREVLGSGDGAYTDQTFTLRQPPLTYVSAAAASGAASTLEVRVNDVRWEEVPTLFDRRAADRVYITRSNDEAQTTVQFGDGVNGARLPSGVENVTATYRKGIGTAGNVAAGKLTTLLSRPLGVKEVVNPLAASGGDDRESRDDARRNAPLTVLTLDRIVSLQDYEDFARAFAGVGKALATWTWDGQSRGVFVTVAGPQGETLQPTASTYTNLLAAMRAAGDPYVPLRLATYTPRRFRLAAVITPDPVARPHQVQAAVAAALGQAYSFDQRQFGQPVALSEVMAIMQAVAGVIAVDVNVLRRTDTNVFDGLRSPLPAARPQVGDLTAVAPAELLTLDSAQLALRVV